MFVLVSFGTMGPSPDTCSNLLVVVLFWMISGLGSPDAPNSCLQCFEQSRVAQTLEVAVSGSFFIISGAFRNNLQSESAQTSSNPSEPNQSQSILPKMF